MRVILSPPGTPEQPFSHTKEAHGAARSRRPKDRLTAPGRSAQMAPSAARSWRCAAASRADMLAAPRSLAMLDTLRPDPTFHPSPRLAMEAPVERCLLY